MSVFLCLYSHELKSFELAIVSIPEVNAFKTNIHCECEIIEYSKGLTANSIPLKNIATKILC